MMIIAKANTHQQDRIDYLVQKISPVNTKDTNRGIIDLLKVYKELDNKMRD